MGKKTEHETGCRSFLRYVGQVQGMGRILRIVVIGRYERGVGLFVGLYVCVHWKGKKGGGVSKEKGKQ